VARDWDQDASDDQMFADDEAEFEGEDGDEWMDLCGLRHDGQCSQAGTEHCDFCCPNRMSDLFAGSAAWYEKHKPKKGKTLT
jgi:hypothetical protein